MVEWAYNFGIWLFVACFVVGYPFGALQSAYFVGKIFGKIDIREHGSGNAGATNVYRVMGVGPGLFILFFDVLKAAIPMAITNYILFGRLTRKRGCL